MAHDLRNYLTPLRARREDREPDLHDVLAAGTPVEEEEAQEGPLSQRNGPGG